MSLGPLLLAPLQVAPEAIETASRTSFRLLDAPPLWVIVLLICPAVLLLAAMAYAREPLGTKTRFALATLRAASIALVLLVLFRPVLVERNERTIPAEVFVLLDDSASMRRIDTYADEAERQALERYGRGLSRLELAREAYRRDLAPLLRENGYRPRLLRFATTVAPLADLDDLEGHGRTTQLGDALTRVLAAQRSAHVTDVVVLSDGRSNAGSPPLEAARAAGVAGLPIHTVLIGDTHPERNVLVELVEAPSSVLEGDEIAVIARVAARGGGSPPAVRVVLEELDPRGGETRPLAEEAANPDATGERVVLVAPPETTGPNTRQRRFRIRVPAVEGETLLDDNAIEFSVHVTPEKIRVLYVDGYPRWEYRYLKNLLLRSDSNLEAQCFLLSATPDFRQESTRGLPPLLEVPTGRRELLESYDVIILGDVNPYDISPDPARCEEFLSSLREFVVGGGGLLLQAGEYDDPRSFTGTALEDLLPIVLDPTGALQFQGDTRREVRPLLADPANPHPIVRLVPDPETNRRLWEEPGGLRGFFWYQPVVRAKPGAQVLLSHPTDEGRYGRRPLLVVGYHPAGRTMFLAVDSTWMWRYRFGDRYHERFWRNAIRWLALGRLKSGNRRCRIDSQKATYHLDERIVLEARVLDEDFRPSELEKIELRLVDPEGEERDLLLPAVGERPGLYRTSFEVDRPGLFTAWLALDGERAAQTEFEVILPSRENADPTPDPALLAALSRLTGGVSLPLARVGELADEFPGDEERREPVSSELHDAWDRWGTLLLALGLLSAEWVLRKRLELV